MKRKEGGDEVREVVGASSCRHYRDLGFYLGCGVKPLADLSQMSDLL